MGTHPIFESDFDCLTDFFSTWDTKTSGSLTKERTPKDVASANAVSLVADLVLSVNMASTFLDVLSVKLPQRSDSKNSTRLDGHALILMMLRNSFCLQIIRFDNLL